MTVSIIIHIVVFKDRILNYTVFTALTYIDCSTAVAHMVFIEVICIDTHVLSINPCKSRTVGQSNIFPECIVETITLGCIDFPT